MEISYNIENIGIFDITPTMFSYYSYDGGTTISPTTHNFYLLCLLVDGNAVFSSSKGEFFLKKNQAILFFPNEKVSYSVPKASNLKIIFLGFLGMKSSFLLQMMNINEENPIIEYPASELIDYFTSDTQSKRGGDFQALSALFKFFSFIYDHNSNAKSSYLMKAINYIDKNIEKTIRINELSSYLDISRIYLYKLFDEQLGISPKEYITNRKLAIAFELMKKQKLSVKESAYKVGYLDQFSFSKLFKRKYQLTPKDVVQGKTPFIMVLDDESSECIWPANITTERAKSGSQCLVSKPYFNKENNIVEGWIIRAGHIGSKPLPRTLDISTLTENGRSGHLTFWIFVENQSRITNWQKDDTDWIRFGSSLDWDSDFQYWTGWHKQITKEGWNRITLPFGDSIWGHICGNPDFKNFCSFSIILSVDANVRVFIDDIKVIPSI